MEKENNVIPESMEHQMKIVEQFFKNRFHWTKGEYKLVRVSYNNDTESSAYVVLGRYDDIVLSFSIEFANRYEHKPLIYEPNARGNFLNVIPLLESWLDFLKDIARMKEIKEID